MASVTNAEHHTDSDSDSFVTKILPVQQKTWPHTIYDIVEHGEMGLARRNLSHFLAPRWTNYLRINVSLLSGRTLCVTTCFPFPSTTHLLVTVCEWFGINLWLSDVSLFQGSRVVDDAFWKTLHAGAEVDLQLVVTSSCTRVASTSAFRRRSRSRSRSSADGVGAP